ncbi:unnamed protein product [Cuscuta campestris]|uniref:Reverse transcriptase zinc-binding domain-containing protein n=1 Tax=Cuscuta campestris TaxID=132261 RepID=A0A484MMI9_9ASTE|nr:unnamed protein product [Cuscuta campestris]
MPESNGKFTCDVVFSYSNDNNPTFLSSAHEKGIHVSILRHETWKNWNANMSPVAPNNKLLQVYFEDEQRLVRGVEPIVCSFFEHFTRKCEETKPRTFHHWFSIMRDDLYLFMRQILEGMRLLYAHGIPHLNVSEGIFITPNMIAKMGSVVCEDDGSNSMQSLIARGLKDLERLVVRVLEIPGYRISGVEELERFLDALCRKQPLRVEETSILLDSPIFYTTLEGLNLLEKLHMTIFYKKLYEPTEIQNAINTLHATDDCCEMLLDWPTREDFVLTRALGMNLEISWEHQREKKGDATYSIGDLQFPATMVVDRPPDPPHQPLDPPAISLVPHTSTVAAGNLLNAESQPHAAAPFFPAVAAHGGAPLYSQAPLHLLATSTHPFAASSAAGVESFMPAIMSGFTVGLPPSSLLPGPSNVAQPSQALLQVLTSAVSHSPSTLVIGGSGHNFEAHTTAIMAAQIPRSFSPTVQSLPGVSPTPGPAMVSLQHPMNVGVDAVAPKDQISTCAPDIPGVVLKGLVDSEHAIMHVPIPSLSHYQRLNVPGVVPLALVGPNGCAYGEYPDGEVLWPIANPHVFKPFNLELPREKEARLAHEAAKRVDHVPSIINEASVQFPKEKTSILGPGPLHEATAVATAPITMHAPQSHVRPGGKKGRSRVRRQREGKGIAIVDAGTSTGGSQREESQYVWREKTAKGSRPIEVVDTDDVAVYRSHSCSAVSFLKSAFYMHPKALARVLERVRDTLGCSLDVLSFTYLGCPIYHGRKCIHYFEPILKKMRDKCCAWMGCYLSRGKAIMIKSVLQAIPTHLLAAHFPPKIVIREMESIMARFFWPGLGGTRRYHWGSWKTLARPMREGGVGFLDFMTLAKSCSAKLWWNFRTHDTIWTSFMRAKYCSRVHPASKQRIDDDSHTWKCMLDVRAVVESMIRWRVLSGTSNFWWDTWSGLGALHRQVDGCSGYWTDGVGDMYRFDFMIDHDALPPTLLRQLRLEPPSLVSDHADISVWTPSTDGKLTLASAKELLRPRRDDDVEDTVLKRCWQTHLPYKMSFLAWRVLTRRLPTDDVLARFSFVLPSQCFCCSSGRETIAHIFYHGSMARRVWTYFTESARIQSTHHSLRTVLSIWWAQRQKSRMLSFLFHRLPTIILWELWTHYAACKYGDARPNFACIIFQVATTVLECIYRR